MTDYSVVIDIILNGLSQIDDLATGVKRLRGAARESEKAAQSLTAVDDAAQSTVRSQKALSAELTKSENQIARYAIANARLKQASGDAAGATKLLQQSLGQLQTDGLAALRVQTALVNIQNNYANSPLIGAVRAQGVAFADLSNRAQQAGKTLKDAQQQSEQTAQGFTQGTHAVEQQRDALGRFASSADTANKDINDLAQAFHDLAEAQRAGAAGGGFTDSLKSVGDIAGAIANIITLFQVAQAAQEKVGDATVKVGTVMKAVFRNSAAQVQDFQEKVKEAAAEVEHIDDAAAKVQPTSGLDRLQAVLAENLAFIEKARREAAKKAGKDVAEGLAEGVIAGKKDVQKAAGTIADTVTDTAKKDLGILSPSRVFKVIGQQTIQGFIDGVQSKAAAAKAAIKDAVGGAAAQGGAETLLSKLGLGKITDEIGKLEAGFQNIKTQARASFGTLKVEALVAGVAISSVTAAVTSLLLGLATIAAVAGAVAVAMGALGAAGVKANAELEQTKLGIATIIASVGVLRDDKGVEIKGIDALNAALPLAQDQLEKLRVEALQTALDFNQIAPAFLEAIGPGLAAGLQLDQIRKTVIDVSQIIGPLTGHVEQLGQELRALFSGDIGPDSGVAQALQITREDVKAAKERNALADLLNEKLKVAAATGKLMGQTFAAATSNLREAGNLLAQKVTEGFFNTLKTKINDVLPKLFDTSEGTVKIAARFQGLADFLTDLFNRLGDGTAKAIDFILDKLAAFSDFLDKNRGDVTLLVDTIQLLASALFDLGGALTQALGDNAAFILRVLIEFFANLARIVAIVKDLFHLLGVTGALAITIIGGAVLELIQGALSLLGIKLESIDNLLIRMQVSARVFKNELNQGFQSLDALNDKLNQLRNQSKLVTDFGNSVEVDPRTGKPIGNFGVIRDRFSTLKPLASVGGRPPKPEKGKGKTPRDRRINEGDTEELRAEESLRKALSALKQAYAERDEQAARTNLAKESALLDQALEDRQISLTDYFAKKDALIADSTKLEIAALKRQMDFNREAFADIDAHQQREIEVAQKKAAADAAAAKSATERTAIAKKLANDLKAISDKSEADRIDVDKKLIKLQQELDDAEAKGATEAANNARKRIVAVRELLRSVEDASIELKKLTGQELVAELDAIDARFTDLLTKVRNEFKEGSKELQVFLDLIAKLKQNARLDEDIKQARLSRSVTDAERGLAEVQIQNRVVAGLLTERQARRELLAIQRAYAAQVLPAINAEIEALKLRGAEYRAQVIELEAQREALKQLSIDTEAANRRIAKSLEEGLRNAIEGIGDQIKSLQDFAKSIVDSVLAELKRLVADQAIDLLFGGKTDRNTGETKQGPIPALIDKVAGIFGGNRKGEKDSGGVLGAITGATGGNNQITATNANTQALNTLTQAMTGVTSALGGTPTAGAGGGGGGGILGGIFGAIGGLFGGKSGGSSPGDSFSNAPTTILGPTTSDGGFGGDGGGALAGGLLSAGLGILGGLFGGGAAGSPAQGTNLLDGVNKLIVALGENTQALQQAAQSSSSGGGGGLLDLFAGFAGGGFAEGGPTFGQVGKAAGVVHGGEFVFSAPAVNNLGVDWLSAVHNAARHGYEAGGPVGSIFDPHRDRMMPVGGSNTAAASAVNTQPVVVRNVNVFDSKDIAGALSSSDVDHVLINKMTRRRGQFRKALGL